MQRSPIVFVTEGGPHIWVLLNSLSDRFGPITVVLEAPYSKRDLLMLRAKKLGWLSAIGQFGTMMLIRVGKRFLSGGIVQIVADERLETEPRADQQIIPIPSPNSAEFTDLVRKLDPCVVFLAGCRMLSARTLAQIPCPVINYHAGITPAYRGMHGGYWALANGDAENFGTTVHLVDAGVDTGAVLHQARGKPDPRDTIASYAMRQAAFSRDICARAIQDALDNRLEPVEFEMPSRQWYHPTIWRYLWTGMTRGVW